MTVLLEMNSINDHSENFVLFSYHKIKLGCWLNFTLKFSQQCMANTDHDRLIQTHIKQPLRQQNKLIQNILCLVIP